MPLNQRDEIAFRAFLAGLLKGAGVEETHIEKYLSPEGMRKFGIAFTHTTASARYNFELYEHKGDPIVNSCVTLFISRRYPQITSVDWSAKVKHLFQSGGFLKEISITFGFDKYIVYGEEFEEWLKRSIAPDPFVVDFEDAKEDNIEAFFGCLHEIITDNLESSTTDLSLRIGVGFGVCNKIYNYLTEKTMHRIKIDPLNYYDVYDPITRYKETVERLSTPESNEPYWVLSRTMKTTIYFQKIGARMVPLYYRTIVQGWDVPRPNASDPPTRLLSEAFDVKRKVAEKKACMMALDVIRKDPFYARIGIKERIKTIDAPNTSKLKPKKIKEDKASLVELDPETTRQLYHLKDIKSYEEFEKVSSQEFKAISNIYDRKK